LIRGAARNISDLNDLISVGQLSLDQLEQSLTQINLSPRFNLAVEGAVVVGACSKDAKSERKLLLKQPRLLEGKNDFAGLTAELHSQAKFLAVALEQ
jgi:hypothetical protein